MPARTCLGSLLVAGPEPQVGHRSSDNIIWSIVLSVITMVIIVHVIVWHANGTYTRMYETAAEGKSYLSVLYNLGLVIISAGVPAFLIEKIMNLIADTRHLKQNQSNSEKESSAK